VPRHWTFDYEPATHTSAANGIPASPLGNFRRRGSRLFALGYVLEVGIDVIGLTGRRERQRFLIHLGRLFIARCFADF
jgi:hypothetical protein